MSWSDDELLKEYLQESYEMLDGVDQGLVQLEKTPQNPEVIQELFRNLHSIKGAAGFFGLQALEELTHRTEDVLGILRTEPEKITSDLVTLFLSVADRTREMLDRLSEGEDHAQVERARLIASLKEAQAALECSTADTAGIEAEEKGSLAGATDSPEEAESPGDANDGPPSDDITQNAPGDNTPSETNEDALSSYPCGSTDEPDPSSRGGSQSNSTDGTNVKEQSASAKGDRKSSADRSLRVDVGVLDNLMDLISELVLIRNQVLQDIGGSAEWGSVYQSLDLVTTDLRKSVSQARMQPIRSLWSRLPRFLRDLETETGKQVELTMEGEETELDKSLLEYVKDPLCHIVRNAVDHGLEHGDQRLQRGKPEKGQLTLKAEHQNGQVNLLVSDDGRGIDHNRLREKAVEQNILTPETARSMSDKEAENLIFHSGFSSSEQISNISGRGVGMDVVKSNIENIGGTIEVDSKSGVGTNFRIQIPLTLAIIPGLFVKAGQTSFVIPQANVVELLSINEDTKSALKWIRKTLVLKSRGDLLPLLDLNGVLQDRSDEATAESLGYHIVKLQADTQQFGLVVDQIDEFKEIVVKPLSSLASSIEIFSGATITGEGDISLILDPLGIYRKHLGEFTSDAQDSTQSEARASGDSATNRYLLIEREERPNWALPIESIARIEKLPRTRLERKGTGRALRYRNQVLHLVDLDEYFYGQPHEAGELVHVAIYESAGASVGVVLPGLSDVTEVTVEDRKESIQNGIAYTGIINEKIFDVVDLSAVVEGSVGNTPPPERKAS